MIHVLIVGSENIFTDSLNSIFKQKKEVTVAGAQSGMQGLSMVGNYNFHLVVVDEILDDMTGLAFVEKLLAVNPMINCAVSSSLDPDEFHEKSEGLGILMAIPPEPGEDHVNRLIAQLEKILHYTGS